MIININKIIVKRYSFPQSLTHNPQSFKNGFSLIELLITLTIIAILLGIAYPNYEAHIAKARRKEATVTLYDVAARLEKYYFENNNSYEDATLGKLGVKNGGDENFYRLAIDRASANAYVVSATPKNHQAEADRQCGTLSLDETGTRKISGDGDVSECWR